MQIQFPSAPFWQNTRAEAPQQSQGEPWSLDNGLLCTQWSRRILRH